MPISSEAIKPLSNVDKQGKLLAKCQANGQLFVKMIWGGFWGHGAMQHLEPTATSSVKWYTIAYVNICKYQNHLAPKAIYFNIYIGLNSVTGVFFFELSPVWQLHEKLLM